MFTRKPCAWKGYFATTFALMMLKTGMIIWVETLCMESLVCYHICINYVENWYDNLGRNPVHGKSTILPHLH